MQSQKVTSTHPRWARYKAIGEVELPPPYGYPCFGDRSNVSILIRTPAGYLTDGRILIGVMCLWTFHKACVPASMRGVTISSIRFLQRILGRGKESSVSELPIQLSNQFLLGFRAFVISESPYQWRPKLR